MQRIEQNVMINAPRSAVWRALTDPLSMQQWMGVPEMQIAIVTDWKVAAPIVITGFHHGAFQNTGTILRFEPEHVLCYSHLSSLSRLPDEPQNYSILCFALAAVANQTSVALTITQFPSEAIWKHLRFYWGTALELFKQFVEQQPTIDA